MELQIQLNYSFLLLHVNHMGITQVKREIVLESMNIRKIKKQWSFCRAAHTVVY